MEIRWRYSRDTIEIQIRWKPKLQSPNVKSSPKSKGQLIPLTLTLSRPGEREPLDEVATSFC
jgi:hypothetical protein